MESRSHALVPKTETSPDIRCSDTNDRLLWRTRTSAARPGHANLVTDFPSKPKVIGCPYYLPNALKAIVNLRREPCAQQTRLQCQPFAFAKERPNFAMPPIQRS
jgi:hypothetical protein